MSEYCAILSTPMGRRQETNNDNRPVPVVHPQICVSERHFERNTAFTDGRYRPLEDGRMAYKDAEQVSFDDITQ